MRGFPDAKQKEIGQTCENVVLTRLEHVFEKFNFAKSGVEQSNSGERSSTEFNRIPGDQRNNFTKETFYKYFHRNHIHPEVVENFEKISGCESGRESSHKEKDINANYLKDRLLYKIIHGIKNMKTLNYNTILYINNLSYDDRLIVLNEYNIMLSYASTIIDSSFYNDEETT